MKDKIIGDDKSLRDAMLRTMKAVEPFSSASLRQRIIRFVRLHLYGR